MESSSPVLTRFPRERIQVGFLTLAVAVWVYWSRFGRVDHHKIKPSRLTFGTAAEGQCKLRSARLREQLFDVYRHLMPEVSLPSRLWMLVAVKKPHVRTGTSDIENAVLRVGFRMGKKLIFFSREKQSSHF